MTSLLLIRHGEVEGISPPIFRGRTELSLTPRGVRQAELTRDHLRQHWDVDAIYCSPLGRCVRTAGTIAQAFALQATTLANLIDIDYGAWSGHPVVDVEEHSPREYALWKNAPHTVRLPQGESLQEVAARGTDAVAAILAAHPQGSIAVVTHDSVIRVLLCHFSGLSLSSYWLFEPSPCGISVVQAGDRVSIRMVNGTQHLMDA